MTGDMYVRGLREFLFVLLELIKSGKTERCTEIKKYLPIGVATALQKKYAEKFEKNGVSASCFTDVDEYYKQYIGIEEELRKYNCAEDDGIYLLVALAFNEII